MAPAHGFGEIDELLKNEKVRECLFEPRTENGSYDLPYLGGYSSDGKTIYFDRHLPKTVVLELDGRRTEIDPRRFLRRHEEFEKAVMTACGYTYNHAHECATGYERRGVLQQIGPGWWKPYNDCMEQYVRADEKETLERVPRNLDLAPYLAPPVNEALLARLQRAMGEPAGEIKHTKAEASYHSDGKPQRHCGPVRLAAWRGGDCKHYRRPNSCDLVLGYISPRAGCDFYEPRK